METNAICDLLLRQMHHEQMPFYSEMLATKSLESVGDPEWRQIVALAQSLTPADRQTLIAFARQVAVDTASTICGGLDGSTSWAGEFLALSLTDQDGQQHAGQLQEAFLAQAYPD